MSGSTASMAYLVLPVFLGVVAIGVVVVVAVAVRREDRRFSLSGAAPGAAARWTRRLTGFGGSGSHTTSRRAISSPDDHESRTAGLAWPSA
jgi:hypothetical protein